MIGINDVWYYSEDREWLSNEVFEERYRTNFRKYQTEDKSTYHDIRAIFDAG